MVAPSLEQLDRDIQALAPWFHNLHLPNGLQTAPNHFLGDFPTTKWKTLQQHIPDDLHGWTALDIGCNAGFYSFELAKRGAKVTGIDVDSHYLKQARWAAEQFGLSVEFKQMQVYDLANVEETYDLVLFMGVFYHLRYPMLGLDIVAQKVRRKLIFQTLTMPGKAVVDDQGDIGIDNRETMLEEGFPKMAFLENNFENDPTNWWSPNHAGVMAMLRSAGMKILETPGHELYTCEPDPEHPACITTWNRAEYLAATRTDR
jgi:tRNA (mo5U34)-methyltransferase